MLAPVLPSASEQGVRLLDSLLDGHDETVGLGSMSCCAYDTAWVACVQKKVAGTPRWLYPSAFTYLLSTQREDGGWPGSSNATDEILNISAAILALSKHVNEPLQLQHQSTASTSTQIEKAVSKVSSLLQAWDPRDSDSVGTEVILPALLDLLDHEGVHIRFPEKASLEAMRAEKLSKFRPEMLYGDVRSSLLHSVEAFYGDTAFDFNRIRHHVHRGSVMASPSATAAYLMRSTEWDDSAEAYLNLVLTSGPGMSTGGAPSAYPSTNFEVIWAASKLLSTGCVTAEVLSPKLVDSIVQLLQNTDSGLVGFAPGLEPDLDDTALAFVTMKLLGHGKSCLPLVEAFSAPDHFQTYRAERTPSLSANCNALCAILYNFDDTCNSEVSKLVGFILRYWRRSDWPIGDKWNHSPYYAVLLVVESLQKLLETWEKKRLVELSRGSMLPDVLLVLVQCLVRILKTQNADGSWGSIGPHEETSYAILALVKLTRLPLGKSIEQQMSSALGSGRAFLSKHWTGIGPSERLWVEKVSYGSTYVSSAYIISALYIASSQEKLLEVARVVLEANLSTKESIKTLALMSQLPSFRSAPTWIFEASWIESRLLLPDLLSRRAMIFSRSGLTKDKYFELIPLLWCLSNNIDGHFVGLHIVFEMMVISFLNYQVDELMETAASNLSQRDLDNLKSAIRNRCSTASIDGASGESPANEFGRYHIHNSAHTGSNGVSDHDNHDGHESVQRQILAFVDHVFRHESVLASSTADVAALRVECQKFLLAHITQIEDNRLLGAREDVTTGNLEAREIPIFRKARQSFKSWVSTTSGDHTSCPYSFAFISCLASAKLFHNRAQNTSKTPIAAQDSRAASRSTDFLATLEQKYFASDLIHHLTIICRMYNDYGSLDRDIEEANVNSINFPEFHSPRESSAKAVQPKARLFALASYERVLMDVAHAGLKKVCTDRTLRVVDCFLRITDVFGELYVLKDVASRKTTH